MTFINNYTSHKYWEEFRRIAETLFQLMEYKIDNNPSGGNMNAVDLIAIRDTKIYFIELKFFRSRNIPTTLLRSTANSLAYHLKSQTDASGLIVVNTIVPDKMRAQIFKEYGISVWDREILYKCLTDYSISLRDDFERLLIQAQQGIDTNEVFNEIIKTDNQEEPAFADIPTARPKFKSVPVPRGKQLCNELMSIGRSKEDWRKYEDKCFDILQYLFADDLTLWDKQLNTDDGLSRFDLICRIASADDYWKALVSAFNSRYVLFEFKNYSKPITQNEIYTTERYLYRNGLRSVAFIIAKNGSNVGAILAAKGALKENGKLILLLSNQNLCEMLDLKDKDESVNDYLSNMLDTWLVSLSR